MRRPRFSVVTPNLNMGRFLSETIQSVLKNLEPGDEYFIIDGGSQDDSVKIIRSFERALTGWISEPDNGYAEALRKGFSRCTGDYLCWINSGDVLLDGALIIARQTLLETNAECIYGDDFYIDEESEVIGLSRGYVPCLRDAMIYGGWTPLQDACYWTRSLYDRVGGINGDLRYAADYDLFLRFGLETDWRYIPIAFSAFRRHSGQKSREGSVHYSREREICRRRELGKIGGMRLRQLWSQLYYWFYVRFRARVLHKLWDAPRYHKMPIAKLHACLYPKQ